MRYREVRPGQWVARKNDDRRNGVPLEYGEVENLEGSGVVRVRWHRFPDGLLVSTEHIPARDLFREYLDRDFRNIATEAARSQRLSNRETTAAGPSEPEQELMIPASKVVEIARKYAERHNMCGVADQALTEMGIPTEPTWQITVTIPKSWIAGTHSQLGVAEFNDRSTSRKLARLVTALSAARTDSGTISRTSIQVAEIEGTYSPVGRF